MTWKKIPTAGCLGLPRTEVSGLTDELSLGYFDKCH